MPKKIKVDLTTCTRCGTCILTCSEAIFIRAEKDGVPVAGSLDRCISCGHCAAMCPTGALEHSDFPEGAIGPLNREILPSFEQVIEMLKARRSIRLFTGRPVEREIIEKVLEAVQLAPSAHNYQATQYVVVQDKDLLKAITQSLARYYQKLARHLRNPLARLLYRAALSKSEIASAIRLQSDFEMVVAAAHDGHDPFLHDAPCLLVAHAEKTINFPESNAAIAFHNATFAAQSLGLGGFLIGYFVGACRQDKRLRKMLGIPATHGVYAALALGYPRHVYTKWIARKELTVHWM